MLHTEAIAVGQITSIINLKDKKIPTCFTVFLNSSDLENRKIEFSADDGITYFATVPDYSNSASIVSIFLIPVTHIKFTGVEGDIYGICGLTQ